jgi:hypothetical protein
LDLEIAVSRYGGGTGQAGRIVREKVAAPILFAGANRIELARRHILVNKLV